MSEHEDLKRIVTLAIEVAINAPERRTRFRSSAYIDWSLIERLRAELERDGIDWRAARRMARR